MNRWHKASCLEPDVKVSPDQTIVCRSCHETPHAAELATEGATASSAPRAPPNKPLGQLKLWWPRSVPYSVSTPPASDDTNTGQDGMDAGQTSESATMSGLYSATLGSNELRLICIEGIDSRDYPLHLNLEVYDLDDCPEYEAVSYTWAGEDGDSVLCKPIYVGPFWDCLLQTKNCWEMLRFVRPRRGIRMLWVDAICINQNNVPERSSQVANMGHIYSSCSRVVVYLGPDIATPLRERHARRGRLHELETGVITPVFPAQVRQPQPYRLEDLLSRRYFSRIWVVQELVLSKGSVMRVGDVDFWADAVLPTRLSSSVPSWSWDRAPAAWVRYISQGASSVNNLEELLWITSLSLATDPRDRVFGLLGIAPELSTLREAPASDPNTSTLQLGGLQVDYSLAYNEVFIGLFGYCLLNLRQPNILCHASCLWHVFHYPTWAPKWTCSKTWRFLFQSPMATTEQISINLKILIAQMSRRRGALFELHHLEGPAHPDVRAERQWHQNASINNSTGALSVNLTHYMPLASPIKKIGQGNGFFVFRIGVDSFAVYLLSEHRLDELITGSGNEQLFILNKDEGSSIYLILRPTRHLGTFQLVAVCPFVVIQIPWESGPFISSPFISGPGIQLRDLQHSLKDVVSSLKKWLSIALCPCSRLASPCSKAITLWDVWPTLALQHREGQRNLEEIENALNKLYLKHIDPKFSPRLGEGDHLEITISSLWDDLPTYIRKTTTRWLSFLGSRYPGLSYRVKGDEVWRATPISVAEYDNLTQHGEKWIELTSTRFWGYWLLDEHWLEDLFTDMETLASTGMRTGEDVLSMLTRASRDEDMFIGCRSRRLNKFREVWNKLQLDGSTFMVRIE